MAHLCIVRGHMRTVFIANRAAVCGATAALLVGLGGCRTRPPHINPPAGIYACPAEVSITAKHHHAKIFFTTDDSAPTKLSPKYTGPFLAANIETVKAIAQTEDDEPSRVRTETYTCQPEVNQADVAVLLQQALNLPAPIHPVQYADVQPSDLIYPGAQAQRRMRESFGGWPCIRMATRKMRAATQVPPAVHNRTPAKPAHGFPGRTPPEA